MAHRLRPEDYVIGWVCALSIELAAAQELLDEEHDTVLKDNVPYTLGRIGRHNVVLACLPGGMTGTNSAATVATQLQVAFEKIRFGLLVGIGGGVPSAQTDIRLGDVVVSQPANGFGGVIQYDFGASTPRGVQRTGFLNAPPRALLQTLSLLQAEHARGRNGIMKHVSKVSRLPNFSRNNAGDDLLFDGSYDHAGSVGSDCQTSPTCNTTRKIQRGDRKDNNPVIHYGTIASGNQVMRHGGTRDKISAEFEGVLCFEMEAAGLMNSFPCLVIRGICDYSDSHKNKRWQAYAAATAAAYAKELLLMIPEEEVIKTPTANDVTLNRGAGKAARKAVQFKQCEPQQPLFQVPFDRDDCFVGRADILSSIAQTLSTTQRRIALCGIGGVGKSQIAIEYSYRYHITHPEAHVFWVHSSNPDRFLADYEDIARHFGLLHPDASAAETIRLVRERLGNDSNMQWLMVVDNADDEDAFFGIGVDTPPHPVQTLGIIRYLPTSSNGSTILTTRNKRVGQRFSARHLIQIPLLTTQDGLELLRHKLDDYVDWDDTQGRDLLELLDHLPLAITQASAYANEEGVSIKHYLAILRDCFSEKLVLKENYYDSRRDSHTPNAVFLTWRVSFNQILVQRPRAAEILSLIAFLDRQCITISLLRHKDEDQIVFDQSVGTLKAYSFVTEDKSRGTFGIHRLLQKCTRMWVESQGKAIQWQESAIDAVHMACPSSVAFDKWPLWDSILAHAELVLQYDIGIGPCSLHRSSIFTRVARYHRKRGRFDLSRERAMAAMSNLRDGPQNSQSHILEATEALVQALKSLGDLKSAEEQCCALRRMSEDLLGKTHPDTLLALNLLARILAAQGKYREAEKFSVLIFMRAMKTYGPDHPETLAAMNDLGVTSRKRKKYKDAERRFRSCLKSRKAVLGPDHPDTLASMNNLGAVLSDQMKYKESEEVMEEAFRFSLNALGEHHDHTLSSRHNLGRLYFQWGKYKKAQGMLGLALARRQKNQGWDHPTTVATEALLDLVLEQLRLSDQEPK